MFAGDTILVTGATGFMGKVLVEKILRSCSDVNSVVLIIRPKRGKTVKDRMEEILDTPLFDLLRKENPNALLKLQAVRGDCSELRLGLSPEDEERIKENVTVFFHAAASVRFDDPLKEAILLNTRGTREAVELAKAMKNLKVMEYVSTTYCHTEEPVLQERSYRTHLDWKTMIKLAEREDSALNVTTRKILGSQPNTYTFSKALGEDVITDATNDIPVVIFRPAVVVSSIHEPIHGWMDNMNGPFIVWGATLKGLIRYVYADSSVALSFTPVDWAIRGMIVTAWARMTNVVSLSYNSVDVPVVNLEISVKDRSTYEEQVRFLDVAKFYVMNAIRYPKPVLTVNYYHYWVGAIVSHLMYGILLDTMLRLSGNKPRLMSLYRKAFSATEVLCCFTMREFPVQSKNIHRLEALLPRNYGAFSTVLNAPNIPGTLSYDSESYRHHMFFGMTKYLFKEKLDMEQNKKHLSRLWLLDVFGDFVLGGLLLWIVCKFLSWLTFTFGGDFSTSGQWISY